MKFGDSARLGRLLIPTRRRKTIPSNRMFRLHKINWARGIITITTMIDRFLIKDIITYILSIREENDLIECLTFSACHYSSLNIRLEYWTGVKFKYGQYGNKNGIGYLSEWLCKLHSVKTDGILILRDKIGIYYWRFAEEGKYTDEAIVQSRNQGKWQRP